MKLLLDEGLPRTTARLLRNAGFEAVHVGDLSQRSGTEEEIIEHSRNNAFSIVPLDADFHALLATAQASEPSVIRLQLQRLKAPAAADAISAVVLQAGEELERGCFVTVLANTMRIRRLPIRRNC